MIDIWMLFTMTVPFLEVIFHTCRERSKRPRASCGRVHQVKPADHLYPKKHQHQTLPDWMRVVGQKLKNTFGLTIFLRQLLLPITSLLFTTIFWITGLSVSYWPNTKQDPHMTDCLTTNFA